MEVRPNTGFLMKNQKKEQDSHPDFTGTWNDADGTAYYLNAWLNTSQKTGNKYFKLTLGKRKGESAAPPPKTKRGVVAEDLDGDIPF